MVSSKKIPKKKFLKIACFEEKEFFFLGDCKKRYYIDEIMNI
jgi:hypothetical protein